MEYAQLWGNELAWAGGAFQGTVMLGRLGAHRCATLVAVVLCAVMSLPRSVRAQSAALVQAVKATYLYKLPAFVSWPPGAGAGPAFTLCVVGRDPFGGVLQQAVAGQRVDGRPVVVKEYPAIAANPGCAMMYVTGSEAQPVKNALAVVAGQPVLTVTDGQTSAESIGVIDFLMVGGRVRFAISPAKAAAHHLAVSSKLLSLAVAPPGNE